MANTKREILVLFMNHPSIHRAIRFNVHMDEQRIVGCITSEWFRREVLALLCQNYKADQFDHIAVYDLSIDYGFTSTPHKTRVALRETEEIYNSKVDEAIADGRPYDEYVRFHIALEELPPER